MSEETKVVVPDLAPVDITRNDVTVKFVSADIKRGPNAGSKYLQLDPSLTFPQMVAYIGEKDAQAILTARVNVLSQRWTQEAMTNADETPKPFDVIEFTKYATEFSARGLTSAQLDEAIKAVTEELSNLVLDIEFNLKSKEERMAIAGEKIARIKALEADKASRKRKGKEEEDKTPE